MRTVTRFNALPCLLQGPLRTAHPPPIPLNPLPRCKTTDPRVPLDRFLPAESPPTPLPAHPLSMVPTPLPDATPSRASVHLKMHRGDCLQAGKDVKTTWAEPTMSIIITVKPRGSDPRPTLTPASSEWRWSSSSPLSARVIRPVCCRKTGLAPGRPTVKRQRHHRRQRLLPTKPVPLKWLPPALLPQGLESCPLAGNNDTPPKGVHTLSIITLAPPPGWTPVASNTSECTDRMLGLEIAPSSSNPCLSLAPSRVDGRCV